MYNIKVINPKNIKLQIPSLKFSPGTYKIYLSMTDHLGGKYIDRIEHSATLFIVDADIFVTGREYTINDGIIIPEGSFNLYN